MSEMMTHFWAQTSLYQLPAAWGLGATFLFQICFKSHDLGIKVESNDINVTKNLYFSHQQPFIHLISCQMMQLRMTRGTNDSPQQQSYFHKDIQFSETVSIKSSEKTLRWLQRQTLLSEQLLCQISLSTKQYKRF